MSDVDAPLQKIIRGTGIIFASTVISMFFGFLSKTIVARYFSISEYGVFNIALTILNITFIVATLGFQSSLPREIPYYRTKDPLKVNELISTVLVIASLSSLLWTTVIFLEAEIISQIFKHSDLIYAIRIIIFALPFLALTTILTSISRGFGRVREYVYFQNIAYPVTFLALIAIGVILKFSFVYVFFAYVAAQAFVFLALTFDVWRSKLFEFKILLNLETGKEIIFFSLPLTFTGVLGFIMSWADTLMLGYFTSPETVGIYNAASPLARLIPIFLGSAALVYPPIATSLYAQNKIRELGRVYQILTKWIFLLTLPIFSVMFLFPEITVRFFFGEKYTSSAPVLQILAVGFMFHTFLGLNGLSLTVIGKPKLNVIGNTFAVIFNIVLNIFLIPRYGVIGAGIATAVSYFIANIFRSVWLYKNLRIHPFSWNYIKPLTISFLLLWLIHSLHLEVPNIWYALLVLLVFLLTYFALVLFSRSIDKEDIEILLSIEKRLGINMKTIHNVLKKFV